MNKIIIAFLLIIIFQTCKKQDKNNKQNVNFIGYWIPEKISWKHPKSGDSYIDKYQRYASFKTLNFCKDGTFYLINSTQSFPITYDSLIFEYEPGIDMFKGVWNVEHNLVKVSYSIKYSEFNGYDKKEINQSLVNKNKKIIFEGISYTQATKYDNKSLKKINDYKNE